MTRRLIAIFAVIVLVSSFVASARAQGFGNSMGSRSGGMGSSGFGSSAFGSGGMGGFGGGGMNGFGNSGFGGMGGGFGNSGFGGGMGGGFGSSGFGNSGFGGGNSMFGNSSFGNSGGGYGGGQNFVGRDAGDMQATFGQMGRAGTQFFNSMNRNMRNNNNRRSTKTTVQNPPQPMRVKVKVAFDPPRPPSGQAAREIRTRLARILAEHQMSQPTVNMEGDTVVVSGTAASENERDVISQLLAIEPGIRNVRNEMTVGQPAAAPSAVGPVSGIAPPPGS